MTAAMPGEVKAKFDTDPAQVKPKLQALRKLILSLGEAEGISPLKEILKWGEPSYVAPMGSTIRLDWKENLPGTFSIYFICSTRLVDTYREVYPDVFEFDGNRALGSELEDTLPLAPLKHCLRMTLRDHEVKHLPLVGA
ncbi:MAG: hypothetical protein ACJAYE_001144 [Candidatus Azotimanducaceae bacterium]